MTTPAEQERAEQAAGASQRALQDARQATVDGLLMDYADVFGTPAGERVLADMRAKSYVTKTTLASGNGQTDPWLTMVHEGARCFFGEILSAVARGQTIHYDRRQPARVAVQET